MLMFSKGLFTRRKGYPCARELPSKRVKVSSSLQAKQISQVGLLYHPGQLYGLYCDTPCNVQDLK